VMALLRGHASFSREGDCEDGGSVGAAGATDTLA
jgi:hypothetical protein